MNNQKIRLSFTIGPVQSFVGQARRTRDLWAGSWLLSFLAETAFVEAGKTAKEAIIPHREDIKNANIKAFESAIGGMPNRFELEFESEDEAQKAAESARDAFYKTWNSIAAAVKGKYLKDVLELGKDTDDIWKRQVANFWEISWVIGTLKKEEKTLGKLTATRKNIRNTKTQNEGGVKCSLMGNLQELSGHLKKKEQDKFWKKVSQKAGEHDFRESERLSAIALVKRLYPNVLKPLYPQIQFDPKQPWPSTSFLAEVPKLRKSSTAKNLDALLKEQRGRTDNEDGDPK